MSTHNGHAYIYIYTHNVTHTHTVLCTYDTYSFNKKINQPHMLVITLDVEYIF